MFKIKSTHERVLSQLAPAIKQALNIPNLWVRSTEYYLNDNERADMVFQDNYDSKNTIMDITCYVVELKSDRADHGIVGQIKKAVDILHEKGTRTKHWGNTVGITVATGYTDTALKMLREQKCIILEWYDFNGKICLKQI